MVPSFGYVATQSRSCLMDVSVYSVTASFWDPMSLIATNSVLSTARA